MAKVIGMCKAVAEKHAKREQEKHDRLRRREHYEQRRFEEMRHSRVRKQHEDTMNRVHYKAAMPNKQMRDGLRQVMNSNPSLYYINLPKFKAVS